MKKGKITSKYDDHYFLRNSVDYDYDSIYDCDSNGCDEEGICRCSTIINERITSVDLDSLCKEFYNVAFEVDSKSFKRTENIAKILGDPTITIDRYGINRILTHHKLWNYDEWIVEVEGGYYGEEIGDIKPNNYSEIISNIELFKSKGTDLNKIKFLLELEYGYTLPKMDFSSISIEVINIKDIEFSNKNHLKNVEKKFNAHDLKYYDDSRYLLPRGIVMNKGNKYSIIDGYHRLNSTNLDIAEVFVVNPL